jgi:hypothetical protein
VLFRQETLAGIAAGEIDLAFRRWPRPRVKVGTRLRTAIGVLEVVSVDVVDAKRIGARDVRRAGFASRDALFAALDAVGSGDVHRIRLRRAGEDPRVALRARAALSADERAELERRIERLADARAVLALIAAKPGVRAAELAPLPSAASCAPRPGAPVEGLGLTESLGSATLSPRGRALLRARASGASRLAACAPAIAPGLLLAVRSSTTRTSTAPSC